MRLLHLIVDLRPARTHDKRNGAFIVATSTGGVSMVLGTKFICWLAGVPNPAGRASGTRVALEFGWTFWFPFGD